MNGRAVFPASALLCRIVRGFVLLLWIGTIVGTVLAWFIPIEAVQAWAVNRAPADRFSQAEAYLGSTVATWVIRWAVAGMAVLLSVTWMNRRRAIPFLARVATEFWKVAAPNGDDLVIPSANSADRAEARDSIRASIGANVWSQIRSLIPRLIIVGWMVLAAGHFGISIQRRIWDWPVYGLRSGEAVLPNISDANREVIRYLEEATPPGSRILVFSDQKLYFLSYYLLPRRLYHPVHPDSEFVIPKPFNQLQLAAYRREDIDPERVGRLRPDFILDYFEGASYLEGQNLESDAAWIAFQKRRFGSGWRPQFLVALRRYSQGDAR